MPDPCKLCLRVASQSPASQIVHSFRNSILVVGDHQLFPGYCVLLLKTHARELHELEPSQQQGLFSELMQAGKAISEAYHPWKMNYASYGNQEPHIHWHLIPRYESDPLHRQLPWAQAEKFDQFATTEETAAQVSARIRACLG